MRTLIRSLARVGFGTALLLAGSAVTGQERPVDKVKPGVKQSAPGTTSKIVGGHPAKPGKYPFQVALIASWVGEGEEHFGQFCGGSLIDREWVLTAAHCVPRTEPDEVDVYIGATVLPSGENGAPAMSGIRAHVGGIFSHDEYDPVTKDKDIALLRLQGPAPSDLVTTVPATPEEEGTFGQTGADVTVIGWGATEQGGDTTPQLMEATVQVQQTGECEENYRQVVPTITISDNMFCAGVPAGGVDSCQGDSGGFIGADMGDERYVQLGVVSWGIGCAQPTLFGVYTRVAKFQSWIDEVQREN